MKGIDMKLFYFALAAVLMAGCASTDPLVLQHDPVKPDPALTEKPTYDMVMAERAKKGGYAIPKMAAPAAVTWQAEHRAEIDAATAPAVLDKFVSSPALADALCAEVKPGYAGDPLRLTQIAAISVYVMDKGNDVKRERWVAALKRARAASRTNDVDTFFRQQLEVCDY